MTMQFILSSKEKLTSFGNKTRFLTREGSGPWAIWVLDNALENSPFSPIKQEIFQ